MRIIVSVFFLLFTTISCATSPGERIREALLPEIGNQRAGVIVGIFDKGEISFISLGDSGNGKAPGPSTIFEIASITKTFTALMFSIAIERGLVTPETTLGEILPEWRKEKLGSITLLELTTHRSGLPKLPCDFHYRDYRNPYIDYTSRELVSSISDKVIGKYPQCKILPRPNAEAVYSNWGSALLGHAIGVKAGLSYEKLLQEWITGPLEMKDTVVNLSHEQRSRLAQGYDENMKETGLWGRASMYGNGAILSTANDLMIYARAMLRPEESPFPEAIRRVQQRQFSNIAYNWFVTPSGSIWHNGMSGGYSSLMKNYIQKDMSVFALSNTSRAITCFIEAVEDIQCRE